MCCSLDPHLVVRRNNSTKVANRSKAHALVNKYVTL
jgi:hypothetical protein